LWAFEILKNRRIFLSGFLKYFKIKELLVSVLWGWGGVKKSKSKELSTLVISKISNSMWFLLKKC
jgi:hypothetical protein